MVVLVLFGLMLIVMLMRVALPLGAKLQGKTLTEVRLTFPERLLYHRTSIYAIGSVLLLTSLAGLVSPPIEMVVIVATFVIVGIPVRYSITNVGVGVNNVVFRPWSEFSSMKTEKRHITLAGRDGLSSLTMRTMPYRHPGLVKALTRFVTSSGSGPSKRSGSSPNAIARFMRSSASRYVALLIVPLLALAFIAGSSVASAQEPDEPQPDRSGLETGSGSDLIDAPPGEITEDDYNTALEEEPFAVKLADWVEQNRLGVNFTWVLITGYLVMFMQAGFALVETGFCRAKNAMHVMLMNFMVYGLGMLGYFVCGFAIQFGGIGNIGVPNLGGLATLNHEATINIDGVKWGLFGYEGFFLAKGSYDVGVAVMFLFQMVFMDTTATIPTGAMAERWKWSAFCVYALFVSTIIYPVYGNWVWGGGWLSQLGAEGFGVGYVDFAGSGVVHAIGGWTGLAGAIVLGARLGKFNKDGTPNAIPGHNIILATLGTFILAFGWFGFNPGSTLGASGLGNLRIGMIATTTMLASAAGATSAMCYTWALSKKPDPGMCLNGLLAGLVAITAPSGYVSPYFGVLIGGIAGVLVVLSVQFIERVLKIDDPVGAISVHGTCGMWGQISLGLFADGTASYNGFSVQGLFWGDTGQFGAQVIGAVVAFVWAFGIAWIFFKLCDMTIGLRSKPEDELAGLDIPELGLPGYMPDAEPYRELPGLSPA